jgi:hypothetical protein
MLSDKMVNASRSGRCGWHVESSVVSKRTVNPIRQIVDTMKIVPHPEKPMIALSIGMRKANVLEYVRRVS